MPDDTVNLTEDQLPTTGAVVALGLLTARALQEYGQVSLFINGEGKVELCPLGELELDGVDESTAILALKEKGYGQDQMEAYLKGRDARLANKVGW